MLTLPFCKLCPGGNPTILVTGPVDPARTADVSASLMHPMHMQAEQVGFVSLGAVPHLQMMGGEFCVNATRAAALYLAREGRLAWRCGVWQGALTVSGSPEPVEVAVALKKECLQAALSGAVADERLAEPELAPPRLYCAAGMPCPEGGVRLETPAPGAYLIHLPGISHLLLDARRHSPPDRWQENAAEWRSRAGMSELPASGVVWFSAHGSGYDIRPAVYVRATASEHMETACGSASLAVALLHARAAEMRFGSNPLAPAGGSTTGLDILQPSGETLTVFPQTAPPKDQPRPAWVSGPVQLVAEGVAHVRI